MKRNNRNRKPKRFLLLDKDDITKVCGSVTHKELYKLTNKNGNNLEAWLNNCGILDDKYYVVEDI